MTPSAPKPRQLGMLDDEPPQAPRPVPVTRAADERLIDVEPMECRVDPANPRDPASLTPTSCADLIEAVLAAGGVIEPIIVRPSREPGYRWDVIAGSRRLFAVAHLRSQGHARMRLPAVVREADDGKALILSDAENRGRRDLSAWERGRAFARALREGLHGSQKLLAEALKLREASVSTLIALGEWPDELLAAYTSPHAVLESDAARISPRLQGEKTREALLAKAAVIADEQATRATGREEPIGRAAVTARLLDGSRPSNRLPAALLSVVGDDGEPLLTLRGSSGSDGIAVLVHRLEEEAWPALADGLQRLLAAHKDGTRGAVPLTPS